MRINKNFSLTEKHVFMPNVPIRVINVTSQKRSSYHRHSYMYTIELEHGSFRWTIERNYGEIRDVHLELRKIVKNDIGVSCADLSIDEVKDDWPLFPTESDNMALESKMDERCLALRDYIERILTYPPYRDNRVVNRFLSVSPLSFVPGLSPSVIEDLVEKRAGDSVHRGRFKDLKAYNDKLKNFYTKRWFCLKDSFIAYLHPERDNMLCFVMLIDKSFRVYSRQNAFHTIKIKNNQRSVSLKFKDSSQQHLWYNKLKNVLGTSAKFFNSELYLVNQSYAPVRKNQLCRWYLNASLYMEHVMYALSSAREEIFITDWWLCPELYLRRPTNDLQYRLDRILFKKSKEGVKIYILLFKEISLALELSSSRTKNILTNSGKNPNIKVLRHPEHLQDGVLLWSHHEKSVIIDQTVGFVGGIDLCFGRWDDDLHRLVDLGGAHKSNEPSLAASATRKASILDFDKKVITKLTKSIP